MTVTNQNLSGEEREKQFQMIVGMIGSREYRHLQLIKELQTKVNGKDRRKV